MSWAVIDIHTAVRNEPQVATAFKVLLVAGPVLIVDFCFNDNAFWRRFYIEPIHAATCSFRTGEVGQGIHAIGGTAFVNISQRSSLGSQRPTVTTPQGLARMTF